MKSEKFLGWILRHLLGIYLGSMAWVLKPRLVYRKHLINTATVSITLLCLGNALSTRPQMSPMDYLFSRNLFLSFVRGTLWFFPLGKAPLCFLSLHYTCFPSTCWKEKHFVHFLWHHYLKVNQTVIRSGGEGRLWDSVSQTWKHNDPKKLILKR